MPSMNLINRYIILEITKYFLLSLLSVLCIFIAIDYLSAMDDFIDAGISLFRALQYVVLKIPFITTQAMPVILLLAILIVFGLMSVHNEIIIINSSGISIYALVKPVLILSVLAALFSFYLDEHIVPGTMLNANNIKNQEIKKRERPKFKNYDIWFKQHRMITHIKYFDPAKNTILDLSSYIFDEDFKLIKRIDAEEGVYKGDRWELRNCMVQKLNQGKDAYNISVHASLREDLQLNPDDFLQSIQSSVEMNVRDLIALIRKVEAEGYDATTYRVDLYTKSAYPFTCIIMALVGISLTARKKLKDGISISITYGIIIGFIYYIFHNFCVSLGYGGVLPPIIAAWMANLIFLSGSIVLLLNAE